MSTQISTLDMTREQWLAQRRTGLGGSDAATVLGLNSYKTPLRLFLEKTGIEPDDIEDNDAMWFGREMEPIIAKRFTEETGYKVREDHKIRRDATHPFLIGNVDRIIVSPDHRGPGVLEIKTTSSFYAKTWEHEVPANWLAQLYHYLMVTGYKWGYIAYLVDRTFKTYYVEVDTAVEQVFEDLRAAEVNFWLNHVVAGVAPEPTTLDDVDMLWPESRPGSVKHTTNSRMAEIAYRHKELKEQAKTIDTELDAIKLEIATEIGDAEALIDTDSEMTLLTYKSQSRAGIDTKALKDRYPDVYSELEKVSSYRVLRVK